MSETWDELAEASREAAVMLRQNGKFRSAISRAYYAAYAVVAARLSEEGVEFAREWEGPRHKKIPALIKNNLRRISQGNRYQLAKVFDALYLARVQADYWPSAAVGLAEARRSLQRANFVIRHLGGGK